jgi:hypothetical protein
MFKFLLLLLCVIQIILALIAEHNEDFVKAIYEMVWLFFFTFLLHIERSRDNA